MEIASLRLRNFRSFGDQTTVIALGGLTALVGGNGSGKTAAVIALSRLFGITQGQRRTVNSDFHVPLGEKLDDREARTLSIEAIIRFPELGSNQNSAAVPLLFRHMVLADADQKLMCRVRLEATYTRGTFAQGEIDERICWITSTSDEPEDSNKLPMKAYQREQIQSIYLPAAREPERELRNVSGAILGRLLRAAKWSANPAKEVDKHSAAIEKTFAAESPVSELNTTLATFWKQLYTGVELQKLRLRFSPSELDELLRRVTLSFDGNNSYEIEALSDGWRSLLYFAIVAGVFEIEQSSLKKEIQKKDTNFAVDNLRSPVMTIFCVEEPENHVSPHYLGRIMCLLRQLVRDHPVQVILTTHSASIMQRIEPTEVRHLQLDTNAVSRVNEIVLPEKSSDAYKFINDAVKTYPELYFARLVILGEGDTEAIVLPRVAAVSDLDLDPALISAVPLGGRHVNHFWRLLTSLSIPFVTLLDFDSGRTTGGWARIKYVCEQLLAFGVARKDILTVESNGGQRVLSDKELREMHTWQTDPKTMGGWVSALRGFDVFFSEPLDLDLAMLTAFKTAYQESASSKPEIPNEKNAKQQYVDQLIKTVYGVGTVISGISAAETDSLSWYRYLFLTLGKPATHLAALARIDDNSLKDGAPEVLKQLLKVVKTKLAKYPC